MSKINKVRGATTPPVQAVVTDAIEYLDRRLAAVEDVIANPKPWLKAAADQPEPLKIDPNAKHVVTPAEFLAPKEE